MSRPHLLALAVLLTGCVDPADDTHEGIAVGNPGVVSMALAESDGFTLSSAEFTIAWFGFAPCAADDRITYLGDRLDLALQPASTLVPAGELCGVVVQFGGTAELVAEWSDGAASGSVSAELDLDSLQLQAVEEGVLVDGERRLAVELASPDWLDAGALGLSDGQDLLITPGDPAHDQLLDSLRGESALFDDPDGSGRVEAVEREEGALALPGQFSFNEAGAYAVSGDSGPTSGCSCATSPSTLPPAALLLLPGLLVPALRRRRR